MIPAEAEAAAVEETVERKERTFDLMAQEAQLRIFGRPVAPLYFQSGTEEVFEVHLLAIREAGALVAIPPSAFSEEELAEGREGESSNLGLSTLVKIPLSGARSPLKVEVDVLILSLIHI